MRKLIATPEGAGMANANPAFRSILINVATPATREHERNEYRNNMARSRLSGFNWRSVVHERVSHILLKDIGDMLANRPRTIY